MTGHYFVTCGERCDSADLSKLIVSPVLFLNVILFQICNGIRVVHTPTHNARNNTVILRY